MMIRIVIRHLYLSWYLLRYMGVFISLNKRRERQCASFNQNRVIHLFIVVAFC